MKLEKIKKRFNFIIFGASGDLSQIKIFPSLYALALQKRLPKDFAIYGYARSEMTHKQFRTHFKKSVKKHTDKLLYNEKVANDLLKHIFYHKGEYDSTKDFDRFASGLIEVHGGRKVHNLAFFAVPPIVFKPVVENLAGIKEKLGGNIELILEKPFGKDRKSAGDLFQFVSNHFKKENLFLIDHYLGKAAVRSIFPLRYNNAILNLLLKGDVIKNIQITAVETAGVDERIGFFDQVGIIKDMIQSHLLQILALLTMSMPIRRDVHSIRREKGDIISALRQDRKGGIVLGQYKGYKDRKGVKKNSDTATFAALRLFIDLTSWYKVPIYIRTGKKLSHKHTYIVIEFKKPAYAIGSDAEANKLIIELYPKERIEMRLVNDQGKQVPKYSDLMTEESLACAGDDCLPPYANLILDAFLKRPVSFLSIDEILASWHFIDEIHKRIDSELISVKEYTPGSEGPEEQNELTEMDNNEWYDAKHL